MADEEKKVKITAESYEHALHFGNGICLKCEKWKEGVDHLAERVFCLTCKEHTVYGVEIACQKGQIEVVPAEKKPRLFSPKKTTEQL